MSKLDQISCALCGSDDSEVLFQAFDKVFYQDRRKYNVVRCRKCSLVYVDPRLPEEEKSASYGHGYPCWETGLQQEVNTSSHYEPVVEHLNLKDPGRVLDVGTGNSMFLPTMKKLGWDAVGTDIDEKLADYFDRSYGIEVFTGELEEARFESGSFDAITIMGVLEHVSDPGSLLKEACRVLKDDGVLVMWGFNRGLEARLLGKYWLGFDTPRHVYSFSEATLKRLLQESGFEVIEIKHCPVSYLFYSGLWAAKRLRNRFKEPDRRQPAYIYSLPSMLEMMSKPAGKVLAKARTSSNIYVFARKNVAE